ncbi:MAG TPA: glycosyltransferase family 9 protein, partial [Gemmatimonadales bacterium]
RPADAHEVDRLLALAGESSAAYAPRLFPGPDDARAADALLAGAGITDGFVALAPGSIWGSKRWSYYAELAERLAPRVALAAVGGPEDVAAGDAIVAAARGAGGRAVSACGKLSLLGATALLARARALVTNDSAPLHLATAVGTPIVALFGPTIPEFGFGPIGLEDTALGVEGLVCRPCSAHGPPTCPLGHHRCMRDLSIDRVLEAVEESGALHRRD